MSIVGVSMVGEEQIATSVCNTVPETSKTVWCSKYILVEGKPLKKRAERNNNNFKNERTSRHFLQKLHM